MRRLENTARQEFWEGWVEDGSLLCTRIGPTGVAPPQGVNALGRAPTLGVPGGIQMERFATAAGAEAALVGRVAERLGGGWIEVPLRTLLPENDEPSGDWPTGDWISGEPASNQWSAGARSSTDLGDVRHVPGLDTDEDADPDAETEEAARAGRSAAASTDQTWDRMDALFHASRAMSRIPPSADDDEVTVRGPAIPMTRPVRSAVVHPDGSTPGSATSPGWSPPSAAESHLADAPTESIDDPRNLAIEDVEMSVRTTNALLSARITTIGQAAALSELDLLRLPNFGRKSLVELRSILDELGLAGGSTPEARIALPPTPAAAVEPGHPAADEVPADGDGENGDQDESSDDEDELSDDGYDDDDQDDLGDEVEDDEDVEDDDDDDEYDEYDDDDDDEEAHGTQAAVRFAYEDAPTVLEEPAASEPASTPPPTLPARISLRLAGAAEVAAAIEALTEVLDSRRHRSWHHARARRRARRALSHLGGVSVDDHPELRDALDAVLAAEGASTGLELLGELDAATFAQVARRWASPGVTDPARRLLAAIVAEVPDPELALQLGVALTDRRTPDRVVLGRVNGLRAAADVLLAPAGRSFDGVIALLSSPDPLYARRLADLRR